MKKNYIKPTLFFEEIEGCDNILKNTYPPDFNKGNAAGDSGDGSGTAGGGDDGGGGDAASKKFHLWGMEFEFEI